MTYEYVSIYSPHKKYLINDIITESMKKWFVNIENKLREIKEQECPEVSDEEFGRIMMVEFHLDENIPFALIRMKTVKEMLKMYNGD